MWLSPALIGFYMLRSRQLRPYLPPRLLAPPRRDILGGSAVYFSAAARIFGPVRLVGVVGRDFPQEHVDALAGRGRQ